jgi:GNAT superfamily N-acetyltransferase
MARMSSSTRPAHGVAIREAVAADADDIGRVRHAAWQVAYSGLMPADYLAGLSVDGFVLSARRMLADRGARRMAVLVAEVGGVVSGFASVGPSRDEDEPEGSVGELYAIYVDPAMWRRGVGARLQEAALQRLRGAGYREATLWVLATNSASRAFYEHTGWRHDGGVSGFEAGAEVLDETRYRRAL